MDNAESIILSVDDPAVAALLPRYLQRRHDDLGVLQQAVQDSGFDAVAVVGHRMRGSGTAYGIPMITKLGTALEKAARSRNVDAIRSLATQLECFLARVRLS